MVGVLADIFVWLGDLTVQDERGPAVWGMLE